MPLSTAKLLELEKRRGEVARLLLTEPGIRKTEIARRAGVSPAQITRDVKHLRDEWRGKREADFEEVQAEHIARLEALLLEAWDAYRASREPRKIRTKTVNAAGEVTTTLRTETHAPSAALIGEIRSVLIELAKVRDLYAPIKQDVTIHDFSNLTDEELEAEIIREAERITSGASA